MTVPEAADFTFINKANFKLFWQNTLWEKHESSASRRNLKCALVCISAQHATLIGTDNCIPSLSRSNGSLYSSVGIMGAGWPERYIVVSLSSSRAHRVAPTGIGMPGGYEEATCNLHAEYVKWTRKMTWHVGSKTSTLNECSIRRLKTSVGDLNLLQPVLDVDCAFNGPAVPFRPQHVKATPEFDVVAAFSGLLRGAATNSSSLSLAQCKPCKVEALHQRSSANVQNDDAAIHDEWTSHARGIVQALSPPLAYAHAAGLAAAFPMLCSVTPAN
eukprot:6201177-Pleurochrysis_carterae.AAC.1